jgi:hypothetical protein
MLRINSGRNLIFSVCSNRISRFARNDASIGFLAISSTSLGIRFSDPSRIDDVDRLCLSRIKISLDLCYKCLMIMGDAIREIQKQCQSLRAFYRCSGRIIGNFAGGVNRKVPLQFGEDWIDKTLRRRDTEASFTGSETPLPSRRSPCLWKMNFSVRSSG